MADVLNLQGDEPEAPGEEKARSFRSARYCVRSNLSLIVCVA